MAFYQRLVKAGANPSFLASCGTLIAISPLVVWANDSLFSLCKVRDPSMEPTLFSGDILVVRKADGIWQRWKLPSSSSSSETTKEKEMNDSEEVFAKREQILAYEKEHCNSNGVIGLLRKPPTPIAGNIVVFKNPDKYPDRWSVERVLATGGETVRPTIRYMTKIESSSKLSYPSARKETAMGSTVYVPPFCIWVEGDNDDLSTSNSGHGALSKKNLVGIAEYRVWPPWRIGKLDNRHIPDNSAPSK